ncbi:hypothetical protein HYT17_02775 [Candidatus Microgenomates bacterium]|nr:hypothetical protein [Candidatus Microgenomates bacterium]
MEEVQTPADTKTSFSQKNLLIAAAAIVLLGIGTGYLVSGKGAVSPAGQKKILQEVKDGAQKGQVYGSSDEKSFKDSAEGTLEKGGVDGEGSHKLIREGGESQTVYLTSSTINLDQLISRKVKVWGQTYKAQKAGWLMDVGRVEIIE